jgi:hypothetical protein
MFNSFAAKGVEPKVLLLHCFVIWITFCLGREGLEKQWANHFGCFSGIELPSVFIFIFFKHKI